MLHLVKKKGQTAAVKHKWRIADVKLSLSLLVTLRKARLQAAEDIILSAVITFQDQDFNNYRTIAENRSVDPDNIQGSHRPVSFMRIKYITRANDLPQILFN